MHQVTRACAGSTNRPRHQVGPGVDVLQGVADHGGFTSRAGRGMDARYLLTRHRKHTKGVVGAQVVLGGEGEFAQIGQRFQVAGVHTSSVKGLFVMWHLVIGVLQRLL